MATEEMAKEHHLDHDKYLKIAADYAAVEAKVRLIKNLIFAQPETVYVYNMKDPVIDWIELRENVVAGLCEVVGGSPYYGSLSFPACFLWANNLEQEIRGWVSMLADQKRRAEASAEEKSRADREAADLRTYQRLQAKFEGQKDDGKASD